MMLYSICQKNQGPLQVAQKIEVVLHLPRKLGHLPVSYEIDVVFRLPKQFSSSSICFQFGS